MTSPATAPAFRELLGPSVLVFSVEVVATDVVTESDSVVVSVDIVDVISVVVSVVVSAVVVALAVVLSAVVVS